MTIFNKAVRPDAGCGGWRSGVDEHAEWAARVLLRRMGGWRDRWERIPGAGSECGRISAAFLEEERVALGDRWFRQEYCCEFMGQEGSLFDAETIRRAIIMM